MSEFTTQPAFTTSSCVAYYRLEDLTDSKGSNTLTNTNSVTFTEGYFGNAANFGAANTNKLLSVASNFGVGGGTCGMSLWIKLLAEIGSSTWGLVSIEDATTHIRQDVRYNFNGGTRQLDFTRGRMNVAADVKSSAITLGTSNWYNLMYTYDGANVEGFINNVSIGTTASTGNGATVGSSNFKIGASDDGTSIEAWASTLIDDVVVLNRAFTATERANIYAAGPGAALFFL